MQTLWEQAGKRGLVFPCAFSVGFPPRSAVGMWREILQIYTRYIARDERWVHGGDSEAAVAGVFDHTEPDERLRAADAGTCSR